MGEMVGRWLGDGMEMGELMGSDAVRQDAHLAIITALVAERVLDAHLC
jgi:hypothetical protein